MLICANGCHAGTVSVSEIPPRSFRLTTVVREGPFCVVTCTSRLIGSSETGPALGRSPSARMGPAAPRGAFRVATPRRQARNQCAPEGLDDLQAVGPGVLLRPLLQVLGAV